MLSDHEKDHIETPELAEHPEQSPEQSASIDSKNPAITPDVISGETGEILNQKKESSEDVAHADGKQLSEDEQKELAQKEQETRELLEKLAREGKKVIPFHPPHQDLTAKNLADAHKRLTELREKISKVKNDIILQDAEIRTRLERLRETKVFNIDTNFQNSAESIQKYTGLLSRIEEEVVFEDERISSYINLDKATFITVLINEPNDFESYIAGRISYIKKQVKKIEKDIHVSFSRYQFSFENQIKRIQYLESVAKATQLATEKAEQVKKEEAKK